MTLLGESGSRAITLDAAARAVGLTKPGLMYHFPTKEALMRGIVEFHMDDWERSLMDHLGKPLGEATVWEKTRAYVDATFAISPGRSGIAIFTDTLFRPASMAAWAERMAKWFELPEELSEDERTRLHLARLAADGLWMADASDTFGMSAGERARLREKILAILK
jgi:AcrR family transcriptional regulator